MLNKDKEYILWLCKRLVYRYNEDPNILLNIESILEKNQTEINFYRQTHRLINKSINDAICNLNHIKTSYDVSIKETQKNYEQQSANNTNNTFENLDIKKLLG